MKELIRKIKEKKELSGISDSVVGDILSRYSKKNPTEKEKKIIIKETRAELRNYVGRFQSKAGKKKRRELLEKTDYDGLMKTHTSTRERKDFYPELIKIIKNLPHNSILDLGCGINPIFIVNGLKNNLVYYAFDINKDDLEIVKHFFKKEKIKGRTFLKDIRKTGNFPEADICLMLKVLDIIERNNSRVAERIISKLKCKSIIASFSTKTLSGKIMGRPRRIWFENLLTKKFHYTFKTIRANNEIFYIVTK